MIQNINIIQPRAKVFWLTGLSGSGKTTLSVKVKEKLQKNNFFTIILDGDEVRKTISSDLGYGIEGRNENVRRVAEVARLFANEGITVLCSLMSPTQRIRQTARDIIGENNFREIYIHASLDTCIQRDTKGLYMRAKEGKISGLSGFDSPFEPPENPFRMIDTEKNSVNDCTDDLFYAILQEIQEIQ
ncbi:MAG: adenylyl-sulfate kinase [Bacteroidia bacterium]|nr:adenylyl-sulfate kinase [Bacteroidia bacterium]